MPTNSAEMTCNVLCGILDHTELKATEQPKRSAWPTDDLGLMAELYATNVDRTHMKQSV